jgi:hypothetical protein
MTYNTDFFVSLDEPNQFVQWSTTLKPLDPMELVYMTGLPMRIRFYREYQLVTLPVNTTMILLLKEFDEWATTTSLATATFTEVTDGDDVYWQGILDLTGTDMQEYFGRSRESRRKAYGALTIESGYMGYGFSVVPFLASISRTPAFA